MKTIDLNKHCISIHASFEDALKKLNQLAADAVLFVVDGKRLIGSLTDGDIRRGLLKGLSAQNCLEEFCNQNPFVLLENDIDYEIIKACKQKNIKIIPQINASKDLVGIINLRHLKSVLPIDVAIMAGGRGKRLKPLTNERPKPLLPVGDKPIIQRNIESLMEYGINDFWFSLRYLSQMLERTLVKSKSDNVNYHFLHEDKALGTIGSVSMIDNLKKEYLLIMNSDILTNLNYESFFDDMLKKNADFSLVTIPYNIDVPFAIMETCDEKVIGFQEKPTYTYNANAGIYLMKRKVLKEIPQNSFFNTTDLMQRLIEKQYHVSIYSHPGYWLDIGSHADYKKAQEDIKTLNF